MRSPHFWDIDTYLNPYIPYRRLHLLPILPARFLGHHQNPAKPIPQPLIWLWSFIGGFTGIVLASLLFRIPHLETLTSSSSPNDPTAAPTHLIIIGSLGATAILEYNAISSPLAQPRNAILGQGLSALIGVGITRLFALVDDAVYLNELRFLAGALAVGLSSAIMGMTKTIHPPAGATALLAATSPQVGALGWLLAPVVMGASAIMIVVACAVNNVQRQFPVWWWTELPLSGSREKADRAASDVEKGAAGPESPSERRESRDSHKTHVEHVEDVHGSFGEQAAMRIVISAGEVHIPEGIQLSVLEREYVEVLRRKFGS